jgi:hypothetical protein
MTSVQYVTDDRGNPVAVQISIKDWKSIKAELEYYDGETEMFEILADSEFLDSIMRGREQARQRIGKPMSEIPI